ncbi:hypothetical protein FRB95_009952 [Tulasnella sp. JGI-2019a]|nr:hypothetical protein FRB95_009952 [Tulasnella sp. JGI-2019a]
MSAAKKTPLKRTSESGPVESKNGPPKRARAQAPKLDFLLSDPKSKLCHMDILDVINGNTWTMLSEDARNRLAAFLPETSFQTFRPEVDPSHPSRSSKTNAHTDDQMEVDCLPKKAAFLKDDFMSCQSIQTASQQFQDHIYSSYMGADHLKKVQTFQQALAAGTAHVAWKDEVWAREHGDDDPDQAIPAAAHGSSKEKANLDNTTFISLRELAAHGFLRVGDIIAYNRPFGKLRHSITVKKDLLVQSIDPDSLSVTFLLSPRNLTSLGEDILTYPLMILPTIPTINLTPSGLRTSASSSRGAQRLPSADNDFDAFQTPDPSDDPYHASNASSAEFLSITASTSSIALESHILPLFDAFPTTHDVLSEVECLKCFTVWRWIQGEEEFGGNPDLPYGGRQVVGTLYYLTQSCPS